VDTRRAELADYGFTCACVRCVREAAGEGQQRRGTKTKWCNVMRAVQRSAAQHAARHVTHDIALPRRCVWWRACELPVYYYYYYDPSSYLPDLFEQIGKYLASVPFSDFSRLLQCLNPIRGVRPEHKIPVGW